MPSRPFVPTSLRLPTVVVALLSTLTGCGSGLEPEVYRERPTVDAAIASVGDLQLRNVRIEPPVEGAAEFAAGTEAIASLAVVNTGDKADELVSVTTPAATAVQLVSPKGGETTVEVGPRRALGSDDFRLALQSLTEPLRPGQSVEMTFTFRDNGRRTLLVPVAVYTQPAPAPKENPFAEHEEAEVGKPGAEEPKEVGKVDEEASAPAGEEAGGSTG